MFEGLDDHWSKPKSPEMSQHDPTVSRTTGQEEASKRSGAGKLSLGHQAPPRCSHGGCDSRGGPSTPTFVVFFCNFSVGTRFQLFWALTLALKVGFWQQDNNISIIIFQHIKTSIRDHIGEAGRGRSEIRWRQRFGGDREIGTLAWA